MSSGVEQPHAQQSNVMTEELKDLKLSVEEPDSHHEEHHQPRRVKLRQAHKVDGVFETGVDVVEQEYDLDQVGTLQQIQEMYEQGKLTHQQMEDLVLRQLKQQKIFAFGSYDEFFNDYF